MTDINKLAEERLRRVDTAVSLGTPDRVPCIAMFSSLPYVLMEDGTTYKDTYYDYKRAESAVLKFYGDYPMLDAVTSTGYTSGRSNEIAGSTMIDWPGRPGTAVADTSTHQVIEHEYLTRDEYPEMINDYMGFLLRKYIPRAFPGLNGLSSLSLNPSIILSTTPLAGFYSPEALKAYERLAEIAKCDAEAAEATNSTLGKLAGMGFPPFMTGAAEVPFDILGDYFRGTIGLLEDQMECPEFIEQACEMFADIQISNLQYFRYVQLPVRRVFIPMHKGMDGFMNSKQYEKLYWKPFRKMIDAMVEMDVVPIIYTEGRYNSRIEQLADVPPGKTIIHFEEADMARVKKVLGKTACISGNFPIYLLEYGTKQQCVDYVKKLIDTCAPGGGYIFDTNASIDNVKRENLDAVLETVEVYGKY